MVPAGSYLALEGDPGAFPDSFLCINLHGSGSESEKRLYEEFTFLLCNCLTVVFFLLSTHALFPDTLSIVSLYPGVIRGLWGILILLTFVTVY